jgi:hypothetical protein
MNGHRATLRNSRNQDQFLAVGRRRAAKEHLAFIAAASVWIGPRKPWPCNVRVESADQGRIEQMQDQPAGALQMALLWPPTLPIDCQQVLERASGYEQARCASVGPFGFAPQRNQTTSSGRLGTPWTFSANCLAGSLDCTGRTPAGAYVSLIKMPRLCPKAALPLRVRRGACCYF